jgi:protein arginine N-methyltransferase 5
MSHLVCAFDYDNVADLEDLVDKSQNDNFDYIVVPLVHPLFERQFKTGLPERNIPLTRSDLILPSNSWSSSVVGKLSTWLNFDSPVERQRMNARQVSYQFNFFISISSEIIIIYNYSSQ